MLSLLLFYVAVFLTILLCLDAFIKDKEFEKIPGPRGIFLLNNALDILLDPVKLSYYFRSLTKKYRRIFKLMIGPIKVVLIHHPEEVEALISSSQNNTKGFVYSFIEPWLKGGLLISKGTKWQRRRKMLNPAFHYNVLANFMSVMEENSRLLIDQLRAETDKPKTNITTLVNDFALNTICETAMGTKLDEATGSMGRVYKDAIYKFGQYAVYRAQRIWMYPNFIFKFTDVGRKQQHVLKVLKTFRDKVVEKRRLLINLDDPLEKKDELDENNLMTGKKRMAMLDLLLQAEKDGNIDADGIGEEVDTFMFGGHDTSANALQFALMLLANHPEVQNKIVEEINMILGDSDSSATIANMSHMKYLECCIKETLRLYPPLPVITRKTQQSVKLKDYVVPAGTECAILIMDLHRRRDQFEKPMEFRPERFMVEKPSWHPYAYIPFSAGPRNCIGQKFAMMELKVALAAILRRYRVLPVTTPKDIIIVIDYVIRMREPIYVKFEERQRSQIKQH